MRSVWTWIGRGLLPAAKKSFRNTAIVRASIPRGPGAATPSGCSRQPYQQDTEPGGANLEYVSETHGTLGLSWMKVLDVDQGAGLGIFDRRDGMRIASVRGQGSPAWRTCSPPSSTSTSAAAAPR